MMRARTRLAAVAAVVGMAAAGFLFPMRAAGNAGPHGGYGLTTDACAGCHRAHTAQGEELEAAANEYELCTTCHAGLVQTDVVNGRRTSDGARLNGGSFVSLGGTPVTSTHNVVGLNGGTGLGTA